jgi:hypothetical protein
MISNALPAASFKFHLAMDTLAVRLAVPLSGPAEVFHLLGECPAGRGKKEGHGMPCPYRNEPFTETF